MQMEEDDDFWNELLGIDKPKENRLFSTPSARNSDIFYRKSPSQIEEYKLYHSRKAYNLKRNRKSFTKQQLERLEEVFKKNLYPDSSVRGEIAKELDITDTQIQIWFQNRRARWRKNEQPLEKTNETKLEKIYNNEPLHVILGRSKEANLNQIKDLLLDSMSVEPVQPNVSFRDQENYKTPQELFSTFKIPELESSSSSKHKKSASNVHYPQEVEKQKHKLIKPNIIDPPSQIQRSVMQSPRILSSPIQTTAASSKPLLVQGHTNIPPFYYMNQGNGYIGYSNPFPPPSPYSPSVYGMAPPYMDPRYLYPSQSNLTKKDSLPTATLAKEIKIMDSSQISNSLKQSFSTIQGQMAANQIPLCLVQDSHGQLHQLVYTVPENLYEKYLTAAKKGFKVRVQPHMNSLKIALTNSNSTTDTIILDDENGDRGYPKNLCDEDLKLVKEIHKSQEHSTKICKDDKEPAGLKTNKCRHNSCDSPMKSDLSSTTKQSSMTPVHAGNKQTSDKNVMIKDSSQQSVKESINVTRSLFTNGSTVRDPTASTSITKEFLSMISKQRSNKGEGQKDINDTLMTDSIDGAVNTSYQKPDLTPSTLTAGSNHVSKVSTSCFDKVHTTHLHSPLLNKQSEIKHKEQYDDIIDDSDLCFNDKSIKTIGECRKVDESTYKKTEAVSSSTIDNSNNISHREELYTNINTIDDILASTSNALIPKSDVEALLKCLKRKLEDSDSKGHLNKRHKNTTNENVRPKLKPSRNFFHLKRNSYDYESSEMLSPETLSEEGSPCNSVFYASSTETASISSPESIASTIDKNIPSVSTDTEYAKDTESITEALFGVSSDKETHSKSDIANNEFVNMKQKDNVLCNTAQNSSPQMDLDFLDNLKDVDIFDTDNFFYQDTNTAMTKEKPANSNKNFVKNNQEPNITKSETNDGTDFFSFPTGQQNGNMDLFDHLWSELDSF